MNGNKNNSDAVNGFQRNFSSKIYASLRRIAPGSKKSNKSKPFLTRLLLSCYEDQFYMSAPNYSYEEQKKKFLKEINRVAQLQSSHECVDHSEPKIEITLTISSETIIAIYMEVLHVIINRLKNEADENDPEEPISFYMEPALEFVRAIFNIDQFTHTQNLEKLQALSSNDFSLRRSNSENDFESYVNLVKIIVKHELENSKLPQNSWNGQFSIFSSTILSLHAEHLKLDRPVEFLARWVSYVDIHHQYRMDLKSFGILVQIILEIITKKVDKKQKSDLQFFDKEIFRIKFVDATEQLSKSFVSLIEKIHNEKDKLEKLENFLKLERKIEEIRSGSESDSTFNKTVKGSLMKGTQMHFENKMKSTNFEGLEEDEMLRKLLEILDSTIKHWKNISRKYSRIFESHCNFSFTECLFDVYDAELTILIKPILTKIFASQQKIQENSAVELFKLYNQLSVIADHGLNTFYKELHLGDFYDWFSMDLSKWDIVTAFKTHTKYEEKILSAINVDKFKPEDETSSEGLFSSSAYDTACIFSGIKDFWKSFKCADENIKKKLENTMALEICSSTKIYIDKLSEKVNNLEDSQNHVILLIPKEIFITITNFNYLIRMNKNCISNLTDSFENYQNDLQNYQTKAIQEILDHGFKRIHDKIKVNLENGRRSKNDKLKFIEEVLNHDMNTLAKFTHLETLSERILKLFRSLIKILSNLDLLPNYFKSLRHIFTEFKEIFDENFSEETGKIVDEIDRSLYYKSLLTQDLILQYRHEMHTQPSDTKAVLTVQCYFSKTTLKLKIINVKDLNFIDAGKNWNSFVKVSIDPKKYFSEVGEVKTKPKRNNSCLINEKFEFKLAIEQMNIKNTNLVFRIKDKSIIGRNDFMAETFLSFLDIPREKPEKEKHFDLKLTAPPKESHEILDALKCRTSDKDAKNFLSKLNTNTSVLPKSLLPNGFLQN